MMYVCAKISCKYVIGSVERLNAMLVSTTQLFSKKLQHIQLECLQLQLLVLHFKQQNSLSYSFLAHLSLAHLESEKSEFLAERDSPAYREGFIW